MFWAAHHILADGYSGAMALARLAEHYDGLAAGTAVEPWAPGLLARLVEGDLRYAASAAAGRDAAWWEARMAGAPEPVRLAADDAPPARRSLRRSVTLDPGLDARLRAVATAPGRHASVFATAAVAAVTHRLTGAQDLVLGLPVTARGGPDLRPSRGCWPTSCRCACG